VRISHGSVRFIGHFLLYTEDTINKEVFEMKGTLLGGMVFLSVGFGLVEGVVNLLLGALGA